MRMKKIIIIKLPWSYFNNKVNVLVEKMKLMFQKKKVDLTNSDNYEIKNLKINK